MPITVPQSVFDKYFDVIDSTFNIFGVTCQLVSIEKKEVIVYNPDNNIPIICNPNIREFPAKFHTCNKRSKKTYLTENFSFVDFDLIQTEIIDQFR